MKTSQANFLEKIRHNYLLLLWLVIAVVGWIFFTLISLISGGLELFGYLVIIPIISLLFSGASLVIYRLINGKYGCIFIIGFAVVIPLLIMFFVRISHWIVLKIYLGDKENMVAGYGFVPKTTETSNPKNNQE